jgi:hypothetical protein
MIFSQNKIADFFIRSALGILVGVLFGLLLSEGTFNLLSNKESVSRNAQRVDLVIPYGTAEQVAAGVYNASLPADLVLVEGDILVVKNEDVVDHQLGPIWVPAGTSGVLELNTANKYAYNCSFQPTKYQGIDVRQRLTTGTRVEGILAVALPTGMMLAVYSYLLPSRKKPEA